jgi:hypothetical protein
MATAPTPDPKSRLVTAIRSWVHMDNLAESFQKQATNARTLRAKHETEALGLIRQLGLTKSTIQISGAELTVAHRKNQKGLSWTYLEREVPAWASRSGVSPAAAASLITWLRDHRESEEVEVLARKGPKEGPQPAT